MHTYSLKAAFKLSSGWQTEWDTGLCSQVNHKMCCLFQPFLSCLSFQKTCSTKFKKQYHTMKSNKNQIQIDPGGRGGTMEGAIAIPYSPGIPIFWPQNCLQKPWKATSDI